jgi:peptidoglycan hydrolase-like protein with peptidoglycan-binding domain
MSLTGIPEVDATGFPGYGTVPQVRAFQFEGKLHESLEWSYDETVTSASPAHNVAFGEAGDLPTDDLLRRCYQGLGLPGEPSDYHFLISQCISELWRRRRREPAVLEAVERLCWLDVNLVEAWPAAVTDQYNEEQRFYEVPAFSTLVDLYEREGNLHEAVAVAERAARFDQLGERRQQLAERLAAVEHEFL